MSSLKNKITVLSNVREIDEDNVYNEYLPNFFEILKIKPEYDAVSKYVGKICK